MIAEVGRATQAADRQSMSADRQSMCLLPVSFVRRTSADQVALSVAPDFYEPRQHIRGFGKC